MNVLLKLINSLKILFFSGPLLFRSYKSLNNKTKNSENDEQLEQFTVVENMIKDQLKDTYDTSIKDSLVN